jgi:hypothetical protein
MSVFLIFTPLDHRELPTVQSGNQRDIFVDKHQRWVHYTKMINKSYSWFFFLIASLIFFIVLVIFDKSSTDYRSYTNLFISGCNSSFPEHHEVAYHYSAFLISKIFFISCDPAGFEIYKVLMFIILSSVFVIEIFSFVKKRYTGKNKKLTSASLAVVLLSSVVPIQVIWNFRGGYSTIFALMFIALLLTERKTIFMTAKMLTYATLSISMHTQSIFAIAVFSFLFIVCKFAKNSFFLIFTFASSLLILSFLVHSLLLRIEMISMLDKYINYKIHNYENYSTQPRLTLIFYLLISLFVILFLLRVNISGLSYRLNVSKVDIKILTASIIVYLTTQLIWNFTGYSFLASRVARVFEPIIMAIFGFTLFYILNRLEFRLRMMISVGIPFSIIWSYKFITLIT